MLSNTLKSTATRLTRSYHATSVVRASASHSSESYAKDSTVTPPAGNIHAVDSSNSALSTDGAASKAAREAASSAEQAYQTTEGSSYTANGGKEKEGKDLRYGGEGPKKE